jgi:3-deoxy-manno-octulosonate cytidylyltransferase (CMP-KDO synthetase)
MIDSKAIAIIPARMNSTRFPGKPMATIHNIPMIEHVYRRSEIIKNVDLVCVATCDKEIFDYINGINGFAVMTSDKHERATERTAEALDKIKTEYKKEYNIVAMIQGDEPMFNPADIDEAITLMKSEKEINIVNLMNKVANEADFIDPNNVKVVIANNGDALYYSREPIPSNWKEQHKKNMLIQTGLIIFRANYLNKFLAMKPTELEEIESCDMLRVLEHGDSVRMMMSETRSIGVDSPTDMAVAEKLMMNDSVMKSYKD